MNSMPDVVVHTYNPSPREVKAEALEVQSQPGIQNETLSKNIKKR